MVGELEEHRCDSRVWPFDWVVAKRLFGGFRLRTGNLDVVWRTVAGLGTQYLTPTITRSGRRRQNAQPLQNPLYSISR